MKTVAIAQARMGSTRFPGKVMKDLAGMPVIAWVVRALKESPGVDEVIIATSTSPADDVILDWCDENSVKCFRGSEDDVLSRFYLCAVRELCHEGDIILRLTCDCPFLDPNVIGQVIQLREMTGAAYCSNQPTWPDGLDVECFTFEALEEAYVEAERQTDRDCVTQYIIRNQDRFPAEYLICPFPGAHKERWVLDTEKDYELCRKIATRWYNKDLYNAPTCTEIIRILDQEPRLREINAGAIRNERFYEGLSEERLPARTFTGSDRLLGHAREKIPLGSQTFSKSHLFYPEGAAPLYVSHGDGARVFDVDGNDYVDLVSALLPVVLGYRDPDVDCAVRRQLNRAGMSFSLATRLETELAEKLADLIPCADMVRFGKSGTDVTTAAIRLARAYTGKERVIVGGYHGWADWSMGPVEGKNFGIPDATARLSHKVTYGNTSQVQAILDRLSGDIAAIIVEPTHDSSYLNWLRGICTRNDIVLIFDEIQTGFRYNLGGAQKFYNVTPDLACFGKSMGNGMPISALVGHQDLMKMMDRVFYSGTFFGDTLSIAAALATIEKMEKENVITHLWNTGAELRDRVEQNIQSSCIKFIGPGPLVKIQFDDYENVTGQQLQALFTQEMAQQGVLVLNCHGVSYAHKKPEINRIVNAYQHTLNTMDACIQNPHLIDKLLVGNVKGIPLRKSA